MVVEAAEVEAGEAFGMAAGGVAFDEVDGGGVFDVVEDFDIRASEPKTDEIFAGLEKDFAEKEGGAGGLAGLHGDEVGFLRGVGVDDANAVGVVKNEGEIGGGEFGFAFDFDIYGEIAAGKSEAGRAAVRIERLDGNGSETAFAVAGAPAIGEIGAVEDVDELRLVAGGGF